ncbi:MAG TPA: porin family protein [Gemmatimonadaceae bacterium]|jgi:hypothetical protein|nr:porin family protein [Gemmatimonadaceae bacterium]
MRRSAAALLLIAGAATPACLLAQAPAPATAFGVLGGVNVSNIRGEGTGGTDNKIGFALGGFARIPISGAWSFQPELEYSMKGTKETDNSGGTPATATLKLNYFEIPLLLRVAAPSSPSGRLFAEAGPAVAINVSCDISASGSGVTVSGSCASAGLDVNTLDIGGMIGGGYEFTLGGHGLSIGARYTYGFASIASGGTTKNSNLQFLAGLRL